MKLLDQNTSTHFKVPQLVLMEQAASVFVQELFMLEPNIKKGIVFCGKGNNGADGLAIARLLYQQGIDVEVCCIKDLEADKPKCSEEFLVQEQICNAYQIPRRTDIDALLCEQYDFVVDAIFGIGLSRNLSDFYIELIGKINQMPGVHVAVDIPSGIDADNGAVMGAAVECQYTITFSFEKVGQILWPGSDFCGKLICANMGITEESWLSKKPTFGYLEDADLKMLPKRPAHSNKGTYGRLLVVAGNVNMAGAAILCARGAYRSGCGLVKVYTREENRISLQTQVPEAVLCTYGSKLDKQDLIAQLKWADAVVLGPGLSMDANARAIVDIVLSNVTVPVIVDADALNIIAENTNRLLLPHTDMIVTPHLGEMARLTDSTVSWIQSHILESALDFAKQYNVICVLKDFRTIIADAYGLCYINRTGNNGMATAGSGDVLSGIIGALVAGGLESEKAAAFGVLLHGLAGDIAVTQTGKAALMAGDIVSGLCEIWNKVDEYEK